jgi:hypothetical protein
MARNSSHKKGHAGGKPQFVPTDDNRLSVRTMAGFGMPQERIRQAIINPHTGRPISQSCLARVFAAEIEAGGAEMDELAARRHRERIDKGDTTAIIWYQKNRWAWKDRSDHVHGHLLGGSERNPENNEVQLVVGFKDKDGNETVLDLEAYSSQTKQQPAPPTKPEPKLIPDLRTKTPEVTESQLRQELARRKETERLVAMARGEIQAHWRE